jgi:GNAT superfamily N-acetyltransferase
LLQFATLYKDDPKGADPFGNQLYIQEIRLAPQYEGRGIATQAMEVLMDAFRPARFDTCQCVIRNTNFRSIGLFTKLGFTCRGPVQGIGTADHSVYARPKVLAHPPELEGREAGPGAGSAAAAAASSPAGFAGAN